MEDEEVKGYLKHISFEINGNIKDFVANKVNRKYLFVNNKEKKIYCSHCKKEMDLMNFKGKHNEEQSCPNCNNECIVKYTGFSRKHLNDEGCFLHFEKSLLDADTIIAKGFYSITNYRDFKNPATEQRLIAIYIFKINEKSKLATRDWFNYDKFYKKKSIFNFNINGLSKFKIKINWESLKEAIAGTKFNYISFQDYKRYGQNVVKYLDLYTKYPDVVEQFTKCGLNNVLEEKIDKVKNYRTINWKAKNMYEALNLSKHDFNLFKQANITITTKILKLYQIAKKQKQKIILNELKKLSYENLNDYECILEILKYVKINKAYKYIKKQANTNDFGTMITWRDYLEGLNKLGVEITKDNSCPKELIKSHDAVISKIEIERNKKYDRAIEKRLWELKNKYFYENGDYVIRPAASSHELIIEGEKLCHCVAIYAERYSKGETDILFIRNKGNIDRPLVTVEVKNNNIIQSMAKHNREPEDRINEFIRQFKLEKLEKNINKSAS